MAPHILSLPTELLNQILSSLPVRSLLAFSLTSHQSRIIANANLHTLSLAITTCSQQRLSLPPTKNSQSTTNYTSRIRISNPSNYAPHHILTFQSSLLSTLLLRHATMLQHIHISTSVFTVPMATALLTLHALKTLDLSFQPLIIPTSSSSSSHTYFISRKDIAAQRAEQSKAWKKLVETGSPVWSKRLSRLRLDGAEIETGQLERVIGESGGCREVVLESCRYLDKGVWGVLEKWVGRERVRVLEVGECGGVLGDEAVRVIETMGLLERLNLYDCQETEPGMIQRWNDTMWHIKDFLAPKPDISGADMVIEVDPEYDSA